MDDDYYIQEALERWRKYQELEEQSKNLLRALLIKKTQTSDITQIAVTVGIKRTTLYYLLWGTDGRTRQEAS